MNIDSRFQTEISGQKIDTKGYIVDNIYVNRFFDRLTPARMIYSLRCAGFDVAEKPNFSYCDVGCGYGLNLLILAICYPSSYFYGVDINPEHIAWAKKVANRHNLSNVEFHCCDILDFDPKLENFDFVVVHGVYSWVEPGVRKSILEFAQERLSQDGFLYLSYNSMPGWGPKLGLWKLINSIAKSETGDSISRTNKVLQKVRDLSSNELPMFMYNSAAKEQLNHLFEEDIRYVAHEYCNEHFSPVYASEVFSELSRYDFRFFAEADSHRSIPLLNSPSCLENGTVHFDTSSETEAFKSVLRNDEFRTDIYSRSNAIPTFSIENALWDMHLVVAQPTHKLSACFEENDHDLNFNIPLVDSVLAALEAPNMTLKKMSEKRLFSMVDPLTLCTTVQCMELVGAVKFLTCKPQDPKLNARKKWRFTHQLIRESLQHGIDSGNYCYLTLPSFGTAKRVELIEAIVFIALDSPNPVTAFMDNVEKCNLAFSKYSISKEWSARFLFETKLSWSRLLGVGGTFVHAASE